MKKDGRVSNRFGNFHMSDMIGRKFGFKLYNDKNTGFLYVLRPTPELWTLSLDHRTQILYLPDISFITQMLEVRPGKVVVESGTGSGSFSHSLARSLYPSGRLHTFEFHPERAETAKSEFKLNGFESIINVSCRNVCTDGFGDSLKDSVDAVFLDLPSPWEAVKFLPEILKKNTSNSKVCCFSPCIEQVERTIIALNSHGFSGKFSSSSSSSST